MEHFSFLAYFHIVFLAKSCVRLFTHGRRSNGFYNLRNADSIPLPKNQSYFRVWCDMYGPHGGWILLQERSDLKFNFYRDWDSYEKGFGFPGTGYWLGNSYLHAITYRMRQELRVEFLDDFDKENQPLYLGYDYFKVSSPSTGYLLQVGERIGKVVDVLSYANNSKFSTWDRDNDKVDDRACAKNERGAWWYGKSCDLPNLNHIRGFGRIKMKAKEILKGNVLT